METGTDRPGAPSPSRPIPVPALVEARVQPIQTVPFAVPTGLVPPPVSGDGTKPEHSLLLLYSNWRTPRSGIPPLCLGGGEVWQGN